MPLPSLITGCFSAMAGSCAESEEVERLQGRPTVSNRADYLERCRALCREEPPTDIQGLRDKIRDMRDTIDAYAALRPNNWSQRLQARLKALHEFASGRSPGDLRDLYDEALHSMASMTVRASFQRTKGEAPCIFYPTLEDGVEERSPSKNAMALARRSALDSLAAHMPGDLESLRDGLLNLVGTVEGSPSKAAANDLFKRIEALRPGRRDARHKAQALYRQAFDLYLERCERDGVLPLKHVPCPAEADIQGARTSHTSRCW